MTPDAIVDRVMSISFIAALPDYGCRGVTERVRHLLDTHPDLAGRDEIVFPHRTNVFWCERR